MAIKNFTQFALSGTADSGDFLVGYKKDGSQELRYTAGSLLTGGNFNFATNGMSIGVGSYSFPSGGAQNIAIGGSEPLSKNTAGYGHIAIGSAAMQNVSTSNHNIGIGQEALKVHNTGSGNIAMGYQAMNAVTAGSYNVGIGQTSLQKLNHSSSVFNTAIGPNALKNAQAAINTVAIGARALENFVGTIPASVYSYNTAIGAGALQSLKGTSDTGHHNTAIGNDSIYQALSGTYNTAIGDSSMSQLVSGNYNTAVGYNAATSITYTSYNTYVGHYAGIGDTFNNCAGLGYFAVTTGNNQVQLGNSPTTTYAYGAVQNRSDIRDKADVRDTALGLDFIMALRPVDFKWDYREDYVVPLPEKPSSEASKQEKENYKLQMQQWTQTNNINNVVHDGTHKRSRYHHGLIAQEVKQVLDDKGIDFGGYQDHAIKGGKDVKSIGYNELIAPLIKAIQELKKEFDEYKASHPV